MKVTDALWNAIEDLGDARADREGPEAYERVFAAVDTAIDALIADVRAEERAARASLESALRQALDFAEMPAGEYAVKYQGTNLLERLRLALSLEPEDGIGGAADERS